MIAFAVYLRVSSDKQDSANQEPDLERIIDAREGSGAWASAPKFVETESAAKERPQFDAMLEACRRGGVRRLYIWSIDRFGRSMFDTARALSTLIEQWGVVVVSVRESWVESSGDPMMRKLLLGIFSWMAEHERDRLITRTRAGLARARKAGKVLGRRRVVIPDAALVKAVELRQAKGVIQSWRAISRELGRLGLGRWSHGVLAASCLERVPDLARGKPGFPGPRGRAAVMSTKGRF